MHLSTLNLGTVIFIVEILYVAYKNKTCEIKTHDVNVHGKGV